MKIEIGESLMYSWLRHVKGCQLVQMNWKPSPGWKCYNYEKLESLARGSAEYYEDKHGIKLYKQNQLDQLLRQAEIDVLGISTTSKTILTAVDIAFHENGLNYGSREETVSRVAKKCFRAMMCLLGYFENASREVIFASPKVNQSTETMLLDIISEMNGFLSRNGFDIEVRLLVNENFAFEILNPVVARRDSVADTSELFLRSMQMYNLFHDVHSLKNPDDEKEMIDPDLINQQIAKIRSRLPRWAYRKDQINHMIVRAFLEVEKACSHVTSKLLREYCTGNNKKNTYMPYLTFNSNYINMKNYSEHNHGKIFDERANGEIVIWEEVKDVFEKYRACFLDDK